MKLGEADYVKLGAWAAAGARLDDAAARLGTSRRSLHRLFQNDERAAQAWAFGRAELHEVLVSKLIEKAKNGDTVSILFALKTLFGYREGEPIDGGEQRSLVTINLPGALAPEQWANLIEVQPRPTLAESATDV